MKINILLLALTALSLAACNGNTVAAGKTLADTTAVDSLLPVSDILSASCKSSVDSLINGAIVDSVFPGAVVLVAKDGEVVFRRAYGYRMLTPEKQPMTPLTVFDLASMSKCVGTLPSVMKLIEEGKVNVDAPVKDYLPQFRPWTNGRDTVHITVRQLLSHTSGLDASISTATSLKLRDEWGGSNVAKCVDYIATKAGRNFRPGTSVTYSCLNFVTLQGIVEKVSGTPLYLFAAKNPSSGMHHFAENYYDNETYLEGLKKR